MRKTGLISIALAAALLPSTMFAGRIDGNFGTQDKDAAVDTNDACTTVNGPFFALSGFVRGTSSGCQVDITYSTPEPHQGQTSALKGTKTNSSSKVSQSINTQLGVVISDADGGGAGTCAFAANGAPVIGSTQENVEKCKAQSSLKATENGNIDTTVSSSISVQCDIGESDADIVVTAPVGHAATLSPDEVNLILAAFTDRKDVKITDKGNVSIKQKGVPNAGTVDPCD